MANPRKLLSRLTSHVSLPSAKKLATIPSTISPDELEYFPEDIIDTGNFGSVYFGKVRELPAAIKVLKDSNMTQSSIDTFTREVEIVKNNSHPNIVRYLGVSTPPGQFVIVMEFLPGGNLHQLLLDEKRNVTFYQFMRIAKEVALGMNWLHGAQPPIIHRDLKLTNVLLDTDMTAKICDFGLSQEKLQPALKDPSSGARGTPLWMAPEVLRMDPFDEKSDVYSMGLLLWSLVTRKEPYEEFRSLDPFFEAVCNQNKRPTIPFDTLPRLSKLIKACWAPRPTDRPPFAKIIKQMHLIMIEVATDDEAGRQLWKEYCLERQYVYWEDFVDCLLQSCVYLPSSSSHAQIAKASPLQLSEYSSRSPSNAETVAKEFESRFGSRNTPECVSDDEHHLQIMVKCAKALLASEISGDQMITLERFGEILKWFGPLKDSDGTSHFLDRITEVLSNDAFHGMISANEAHELLNGHPAGVYLIRFSSQHGQYAISYMNGSSTINHTRIVYRLGRGFAFRDKYYATLGELIGAATPVLKLTSACPGSKYRLIFTPANEMGLYKTVQ